MREGSGADVISVEPTPRTPSRSRAQVWLRVLVSMLLIVGVVVAGSGVYHWWTRPTLLGGPYGDQSVVSSDPHTVWSFPLSKPHPGHADTVTFRGAPEPVWKINTAGATLTVEICSIGSSNAPGEIDVNNGPPERFCNSITPVRDGTTFRYPSAHEWLLAEVQASRPGRATLATITYNYKAGTHLWSQRGLDTQTFRITFNVH
jgi:hypothetical protein